MDGLQKQPMRQDVQGHSDEEWRVPSSLILKCGMWICSFTMFACLLTMWATRGGNSEFAARFFFLCTTLILGFFLAVTYLAIRMYASAEKERLRCRIREEVTRQELAREEKRLEHEERELRAQLEADRARHREILEREQNKAREISRMWHEFCHDEREALLRDLEREEVFSLLQRHCELVRQVFKSGYPDYDFHVTIKMFSDPRTLLNVARDVAGILQTRIQDGSTVSWRNFDVHSTIGEDGDSDFVLLAAPREPTPMDQPNWHRVWASDDLPSVQGESLSPDGLPYRNRSLNYPGFYNAAMVVPICKSGETGAPPSCEFIGFLCVDTLRETPPHPRIFGTYNKPNDTFAFLLRAAADILYCILRNGLDNRQTIPTSRAGVSVSRQSCELAAEFHERFCERARSERDRLND